MNNIDVSSLKNIDIQLGLKYSEDMETYAAVLGDFHHFIGKNASAIEISAADRAQEDYVREVHKLKSSARLIGATALSELAYRLEMLGRDGQWSEIEQLTPELLSKYREFDEILRPFGKHQSAAKAGELTPEELRQVLLSLKKSVAAFDYDGAMQGIASLEEHSLAPKLERLFAELRDSVESFEFDRAEDYVNQMMA